MSYYLNKTIEYGLYFLVFLLPLQTRWIIKPEASEYLTISLYGTDVLLLIIVALFIVFKLQITNYKLQITNKSQIPNPKFLFLSIVGLAITIFVSVFFAPDKLIAVYKCGVFLLGIGLFWLIVRANYNKLKLIYAFLAGIFLQACLGIWQFLTQSSFANKWLGMAAHNAGDLGVSVVETLRGERWLRAYGGLDHPNVLGGVLTIAILLVINAIIKNHKSNAPYFKFSIFNFQFSIFKHYLFFISYFLFLIFVAALFFTFSRGAWAGLIIGLLVMLFMAVVRKDLIMQKKLLQIILISSVLIFILFSQFQDLVLTRLSQDARLEVKSNNERVESLRESWEIIKGNWLFGVGIGNYILGIKNYELRITNTNGDKPAWYYQPVHNVFLLVWAELGIFGLLFFILIPLFIIHNSLFKNNLRSKNLTLNITLLAAITAMFMVDHWWWSLHFGVLLFWLILGLIFAIDRGNNKTYNENVI